MRKNDKYYIVEYKRPYLLGGLFIFIISTFLAVMSFLTGNYLADNNSNFVIVALTWMIISFFFCIFGIILMSEKEEEKKYVQLEKGRVKK